MDKGMLKEMKDHLHSLKAPIEKEAQKLFPNHPKARAVYVQLKSGDGGIQEVVKTLGLQKEYNSYAKDFNQYCDKDLNESAGICLNDFVEFCIDELKQNFYLFK